MKINRPEERLEQFWGDVDQKHVRSILKYVKGEKILDIGCGYGTTTFYASKQGYECIGIDYDEKAIEFCRKRYPECNYLSADAEDLPFENSYFDTVILRDSLHHLYGEADFEKVKNELNRVLKNNSRMIFFDPNVNLLLRIMRSISFHKDEECNYETAQKIMNELGFKIIYSEFNTVYSLPLSGGYVGINFIPNISFIKNSVLYTEKLAEKIVNSIHLGRQLCWRYLIVGEK
jgi:ubiquinone/menaquinone biosynthesis C-methylase UbiE